MKLGIVGLPNVGKSTLYNLLAGEDAAIVTDVAGTTRDVLERTVSLGRVTLRLTDTAGVRSGNDVDKVERIGIDRSKARISSAELILAVFDLSRPFDEADRELIDRAKFKGRLKPNVIVPHNMGSSDGKNRTKHAYRY